VIHDLSGASGDRFFLPRVVFVFPKDVVDPEYILFFMQKFNASVGAELNTP
jgi:hypothetical protein